MGILLMDNALFGVVIKVRNLEQCRAFYRDVLDLGAPVMDSNFWVEFKICDQTSLYLEKAEWEDEIPQSQGRISWVYKVDDIDDFISRMKAYGFDAVVTNEDKVGFALYRFKDPEGNPFFVSSRQSDDQGQ